ncbi:hypothetical protein [Sporichthya brevicatena]|uniref:hypothetical protein n=1 Tax=Sporichthya brevicatena TaxID=171442 RepID=UPI0031D1705E
MATTERVVARPAPLVSVAVSTATVWFAVVAVTAWLAGTPDGHHHGAGGTPLLVRAPLLAVVAVGLALATRAGVTRRPEDGHSAVLVLVGVTWTTLALVDLHLLHALAVGHGTVGVLFPALGLPLVIAGLLDRRRRVVRPVLAPRVSALSRR